MVGAGYMRILNEGSASVRLVGGETPTSATLEVHTMSMDNGVMRMRPASEGLEIAAGASVELKPGGYQLMLIGLKAPLAEGASGPLRLSDLHEPVLLVGLIFTRCTSVCQALGVRYRQLQGAMQAAGSNRVRLLSISVDPAYDTPERLAAYQRRFGGARSSWTVARPIDERTLSILIRATGLLVIPERAGGFSHSDSLHPVSVYMLYCCSD